MMRYFIALLLLAVLLPPALPAQSMLELPSPATMMPMDSPDHELELFALIHTEDHPAFGLWPLGIGDINDDGFDDLAVGTGADTTFIFLGGSPFDHQPDLALLGGASGITAGDFNGDGFEDLCVHGSWPDDENNRMVYFMDTWLGHQAISRILPNDSIPNQRPLVNVAPVIVCPVGDMSGDGQPVLRFPCEYNQTDRDRHI